ncbi:hypothetical protein GLYMA_15G017800v4 [Glycine max]|nr:hypothetical protein GLYMA_15G017800v4 [Glycine max]KAH1145034.1 hypothetical protein GYH30_041055 [Glycine max]
MVQCDCAVTDLDNCVLFKVQTLNTTQLRYFYPLFHPLICFIKKPDPVMDMPVDKDDAPTSKRTSKKPIYSKFSQQELPAWKPILTPGWVIATFSVIGVIFIPIGLASLFSSESVEHKMEAPIYIYYQLDNYYQNHRRYVKSRNDKQLWNKAAEGETNNCFPEDKTKDNQPIVPCGLIAWSMFNDTYKFSTSNKDLTVNKKNIAWGSEQRSKFASDVYPKNFQRGDLIGGAKLNESIPLSQQEDLIVWMRTAALPTFRKLYGKIEVDLEVNDEIEIAIENNYNTYEFGGKKNLVLSTTTVMGGKNPFLGTAYLFVGGLSLFCAIAFILLYVIKPRPLGDPSYLSWNRNPGSMK